MGFGSALAAHPSVRIGVLEGLLPSKHASEQAGEATGNDTSVVGRLSNEILALPCAHAMSDEPPMRKALAAASASLLPVLSRLHEIGDESTASTAHALLKKIKASQAQPKSRSLPIMAGLALGPVRFGEDRKL